MFRSNSFKIFLIAFYPEDSNSILSGTKKITYICLSFATKKSWRRRRTTRTMRTTRELDVQHESCLDTHIVAILASGRGRRIRWRHNDPTTPPNSMLSDDINITIYKLTHSFSVSVHCHISVNEIQFSDENWLKISICFYSILKLILKP